MSFLNVLRPIYTHLPWRRLENGRLPTKNTIVLVGNDFLTHNNLPHILQHLVGPSWSILNASRFGFALVTHTQWGCVGTYPLKHITSQPKTKHVILQEETTILTSYSLMHKCKTTKSIHKITQHTNHDAKIHLIQPPGRIQNGLYDSINYTICKNSNPHLHLQELNSIPISEEWQKLHNNTSKYEFTNRMFTHKGTHSYEATLCNALIIVKYVLPNKDVQHSTFIKNYYGINKQTFDKIKSTIM